MATKAPSFTPECDQVQAVALVDPEPATVSLLHTIDMLTHALASGWGYPGYIIGLSLPTNASDVYLLGHIPPTVRYFRVGCLVSGSGSVTIQAGTGDTTSISWVGGGGLDVGLAKWVWSSGLMDDSASAAVGPALKFVVAQHWYPKTTILTLNPADAAIGTAPTGRIHAVACDPIWEDVST